MNLTVAFFLLADPKKKKDDKKKEKEDDKKKEKKDDKKEEEKDDEGSKEVGADETSLEVTGLKPSHPYDITVFALAGPECSEPAKTEATTSKFVYMILNLLNI